VTHSLDESTAAEFAAIVLDGIEREYPNQITTLLTRAKDLVGPQERTPAFFGCFDWHSAVHSHWTLVRLRRRFPDAGFVGDVNEALAGRLSAENLAAELRFLTRAGNERFELPYGLAWLLQLCAELRETDALTTAMRPLEQLARDRMESYALRLPRPVRSGEHSQSAFAMGLALDWASVAEDDALTETLAQRARAFHERDVDAPLAYEPSGYDFVSPSLASADLLRRVMDEQEFGAWLTCFLSSLPTEGDGAWLAPVGCADPSDGKLSHWNGLNLSRAWMLDGIASGLPHDDSRRAALSACAAAHLDAGLPSVTGEHYMGSHWLPSFATYALSRRGVRH
jgi:hypothetical protein